MYFSPLQRAFGTRCGESDHSVYSDITHIMICAHCGLGWTDFVDLKLVEKLILQHHNLSFLAKAWFRVRISDAMMTQRIRERKESNDVIPDVVA